MGWEQEHEQAYGCGGTCSEQHVLDLTAEDTTGLSLVVEWELDDREVRCVRTCSRCGELDGIVPVSGRSPRSYDFDTGVIIDPAEEQYEGAFDRAVRSELAAAVEEGMRRALTPNPNGYLGIRALIPTEAEEEEEAPDPNECGRWNHDGRGHFFNYIDVDLEHLECGQCDGSGCPWLVALMAIGIPTPSDPGEG